MGRRGLRRGRKEKEERKNRDGIINRKDRTTGKDWKKEGVMDNKRRIAKVKDEGRHAG